MDMESLAAALAGHIVIEGGLMADTILIGPIIAGTEELRLKRAEGVSNTDSITNRSISLLKTM